MGPVLYVVTVAGEVVISGFARFCLAYGLLWIAGLFVELPFGASLLARAAVLVPFLWSAVALVRPGRRWFWRRMNGARRPGVTEEQKLREAFQEIGEDPELVDDVWVLDRQVPESAARAGALMVSRVLIECEGLRAVLAHEVSHWRHLDARLAEALRRLGFWVDPLRLPEGEVFDDGVAVSIVWQLVRVLVLCAGGRPVARLLQPLWAAHWRACEYRADAEAVACGWGTELLAHLREFELVLDGPQAGLLRGRFDHPPVALRISRLQELLDVGEA
jgi:Zn-dependent protease with chaperone function